MIDEIKDRMTKLGVTQVELGKRLGWPQSTIARYLTGSVEPSVSKIQEMIAALDGEIRIKWQARKRN